MAHEESNRRRFTRILFDTSCELTQDERVWQTRVMDISLQGLLVLTPAEWDGNAERMFGVTVFLTGTETTIDMTVSLVHTANERLGFRCRNISLDSATHLRRLVELNLGDEELMHRELEALISQDQIDEA